MYVILLSVLMVITLAMIGMILLQRSEGGALGVGGNPMGGMMSRRGASNFLTRATAILAAGFMGICLLLAIISGYQAKHSSIVESLVAETEIAEAEAKEEAATQDKAAESVDAKKTDTLKA